MLTFADVHLCRPPHHTQIMEDMHRVFDTGYFSLCTPVAEETRDGIKFTLEVWGCCVRGSLLSPSSCLACHRHRVPLEEVLQAGLAAFI